MSFAEQIRRGMWCWREGEVEDWLGPGGPGGPGRAGRAGRRVRVVGGVVVLGEGDLLQMLIQCLLERAAGTILCGLAGRFWLWKYTGPSGSARAPLLRSIEEIDLYTGQNYYYSWPSRVAGAMVK